MSKKKTDEEFRKELKQINPNIEPLEEYKGANTIISFKCLKCNHIWKTTPSAIINTNNGCPNCARRPKITNEIFKNRLKKINKNLQVLTEYKSRGTKVKIKCLKCNYIWEAKPGNLLNNRTGCPQCTGNIKKTNGQFLKELKLISPELEPLEEYINKGTKIKIKCTLCGNIWLSTPDRLLRSKSKCPICAKNRRTKPEKIFEEEIFNINPNFELLDKYVNSKKKLRVKCKTCGTIKLIEPNTTLNLGYIKCNTCNPTGSMEEQRLADNLTEEINKQTNELKELYKMERNVRMSDLSGRQFEIDIYFPNLKIGVEYDGVYYHNDKVKYQRYILDKKEFFWDNFGIHIIFVNSIEYNYNPDVVQDKIMSALNIYKKLAYARKLKVIEVDYETSTEFLELNHIQGGDSSGVRFGLVTKKTNVLVALMTFSKVRNIVKSKSDAKDTYELVRYCVMKGLKITGGFSKLLKHAEKYLQSIGVKYIKTFADRRFTKDSDNVYLRNGFELSNISGQNYLYFKNGEVLTRYQCQKHKLRNLLGEENFDESMTERENMLFNGYSVYWDCGNLVYYKEIAKP